VQPEKTRPVLFSGPMVRAILEGGKTQTRRVMKPQPYLDHCLDDGNEYWIFREVSHPNRSAWPKDEVPYWKACPYGDAGDRLWVREGFFDHGPLPADGLNYQTPLDARIEYRATSWDRDNPELAGAGWKPSIHMPRWASRLTLEITEIRVERLQEISDEDACAEGVSFLDHDITSHECRPVNGESAARFIWRHGWDTLNAKRGYSWDSNPWVWVISFIKRR
jgi:hypothetical protein